MTNMSPLGCWLRDTCADPRISDHTKSLNGLVADYCDQNPDLPEIRWLTDHYLGTEREECIDPQGP